MGRMIAWGAGGMLLASVSAIPGTPWTLVVEFPRATVMARSAVRPIASWYAARSSVSVIGAHTTQSAI